MKATNTYFHGVPEGRIPQHLDLGAIGNPHFQEALLCGAVAIKRGHHTFFIDFELV